MPRIALEERLAAVFIGRPIFCLVPPPVTSSGLPAAVASASTRANSRSSMGRICERTATVASRGFAGGRAAVEREYLGRVHEPLGVEHGLDPHLQGEVCLGELHAHQVALLDADAVLAGQAAPRGHA